jgi:hypothetical protein
VYIIANINILVKDQYRFRISISTKAASYNVKVIPLQPMGPRGFWEVKAPRFHDIGT